MLDNSILEQEKNKLETGQWWAIPWWQEDQYYDDELITRKDAEAAFNELKETFKAGLKVSKESEVLFIELKRPQLSEANETLSNIS